MNDQQKNILGTYQFLYIGAEYLDASYNDMIERAKLAVSNKYMARFTAPPREAKRLTKLHDAELRKAIGQVDRLKKLLDDIAVHFDKSHPNFQKGVEELYDTFDKTTEDYGN